MGSISLSHGKRMAGLQGMFFITAVKVFQQAMW
jgi:hypothetical protein